MASGIATALLKGCGLAGRVNDYDMAVLEVDERSSVRVYLYITPDYIAVTNLFRDSIMRNADVYKRQASPPCCWPFPAVCCI